MGRPIADPAQTEALFKVAKELGYNPNELIPVGHSVADKGGTLVHSVRIGRKGTSKLYKNDSDWSRKAVADLKRGFFGAP